MVLVVQFHNSCVPLAKEFQSNYKLFYAISPAICSTCSFIKMPNRLFRQTSYYGGSTKIKACLNLVCSCRPLWNNLKWVREYTNKDKTRLHFQKNNCIKKRCYLYIIEHSRNTKLQASNFKQVFKRKWCIFQYLTK